MKPRAIFTWAALALLLARNTFAGPLAPVGLLVNGVMHPLAIERGMIVK